MALGSYRFCKNRRRENRGKGEIQARSYTEYRRLNPGSTVVLNNRDSTPQ